MKKSIDNTTSESTINNNIGNCTGQVKGYVGIAEVYRYTVTARYSYDFSIANIYGHTTEQDSWWAWFYDGEDWFTRDNDTAHAKAVATGHYRHYNSGNTSDPTIVFDVFKDGKCDVDGA